MMRDYLFRLRLYRGTLIKCPYGVVTCRVKHPPNPHIRTYIAELNPRHHSVQWLLDECEGPWRLRLLKPRHFRRFAIAFARAADALTFRIIAADNAD